MNGSTEACVSRELVCRDEDGIFTDSANVFMFNFNWCFYDSTQYCFTYVATSRFSLLCSVDVLQHLFLRWAIVLSLMCITHRARHFRSIRSFLHDKNFVDKVSIFFVYLTTKFYDFCQNVSHLKDELYLVKCNFSAQLRNRKINQFV